MVFFLFLLDALKIESETATERHSIQSLIDTVSYTDSWGRDNEGVRVFSFSVEGGAGEWADKTGKGELFQFNSLFPEMFV